MAAKHDQALALIVQTAERQSTNEFEIAKLKETAEQSIKARELDAENIRRLANIAAAHQDEPEDLATRLDRLEGKRRSS